VKKKHLFVAQIVIILAAIITPTSAAEIFHTDFLETSPQGDDSYVTCGNPSIAYAETCRKIEDKILKATIRMRIDTWVVKDRDSGYEIDSSFAHATLKDDRFLVTHNHFSIPLYLRSRDGESEAYRLVTMSNSNGEILYEGPLSDFELVWEDREALVIASKEEGFFERLGFVSAKFSEWSSIPLADGMEVAQVDWDGETTRVDWTKIQEVDVKEEVPQMVLADGVTLGASGGGIFLGGIHIANNWLRVQQFEESGALIGTTTKVALNTAQVVDDPGIPLYSD
jgi:hypothetical protein